MSDAKTPLIVGAFGCCSLDIFAGIFMILFFVGIFVAVFMGGSLDSGGSEDTTYKGPCPLNEKLIGKNWCGAITEATSKFRLDPAIAAAILMTEHGGLPQGFGADLTGKNQIQKVCMSSGPQYGNCVGFAAICDPSWATSNPKYTYVQYQWAWKVANPEALEDTCTGATCLRISQKYKINKPQRCRYYDAIYANVEIIMGKLNGPYPISGNDNGLGHAHDVCNFGSGKTGPPRWTRECAAQVGAAYCGCYNCGGCNGNGVGYGELAARSFDRIKK